MQTERKEKLTAINGWKVLLLLPVFFCHAEVSLGKIDFVRRAMEFFFLSSGFLVAYNHLDSCSNLGINYFKKKVYTIYPLYFFVTLMYFFMIRKYQLTTYSLTLLGINLLMLQVWSPKIYYSLNFAGWFICNLMICYGISGVLLKTAKKFEKKPFFLFIALFIIRQITESISLLFPDSFFQLYYYVHPIGRVLEFAMGMMLYPLFSQINRNGYLQRKNILLWTAIEISYLFILVYLCNKEQESWTSAQFVFILCIGLLIFAEGRGYVSRLLSCKPLIIAGKIQYEFYMLHALILDLFRIYFEQYFAHGKTLICFGVTVILSFFYMRFLRNRMSEIFNRAIQSIDKVLT